ncbi:MAG: nucleotidyltransferase family protein [Pseudomonadota bacterium]
MCKEPDTLMIFAAGLGTRMRPLTETKPKALLEVAGRPLIDHLIAYARPLGLNITVNTYHHADQIEAHLGNSAQFSREGDLLRDTGGGLKLALPQMGPGPVYTGNPDAIWRGPNPLALLKKAWDPTRMDALVLLVPPQRCHGRAGGGDFSDIGGGQLVRDPGGLIYGGCQIMKTGRVARVPEVVFSLNTIWSAMIADGALYGTVYPGQWVDVGTPENLALANELLANV